MSVGLLDRNILNITRRGQLPTDQRVKMKQILIRTTEGLNGIAVVLCIPMTVDNGSLAILKSSIHPQ